MPGVKVTRKQALRKYLGYMFGACFGQHQNMEIQVNKNCEFPCFCKPDFPCFRASTNIKEKNYLNHKLLQPFSSVENVFCGAFVT